MHELSRRSLLTGLIAAPFIIPSKALASLGSFCPPAVGGFGSGGSSFGNGDVDSLPVEDFTGAIPLEVPTERSISVVCVHTGDSWSGKYVSGGSYIPEALESLNWVFKDWRLKKPAQMDPALFDIIHDINAMLGLSTPWRLNSGYRSPASNASVGGARQSFHMRAKAADITNPGASPATVQGAARALQKRRGRGGVGHYSSFTHVDSRGSVSTWSG